MYTLSQKYTLNLGIKTEPVTVGPLVSGPSILIKTKAGHTIQYTLLLHPLQIRLIFGTLILGYWILGTLTSGVGA